MLVALCRTGGGKVRWRQGDQPGDPCSLPDQRWSLGQGEGGMPGTGAWEAWWAGTHATGRGVADVSRSPASGHHRLVECHTSHAPKGLISQGHQGTNRWLLSLEESGPCPGRHGPGKHLPPETGRQLPLGGRLLRCQPAIHSGSSCLCCSTGARKLPNV